MPISRARANQIRDVMRQAAGPTGAMVGFFLEPEDAQALALDASVLPDGSEPEPAERLHLTLAHLGKADEIDVAREDVLAAVRTFAGEAADVKGKVSGIGRFLAPEGEPTPLYASFDSPTLQAWRAALKLDVEAVGIEIDRDHGFTPHITLAYLPADAPTPAVMPEPRELRFDAVALAWKGETEVLPLGGPELEENRAMTNKPRRRLTIRQAAARVGQLIAELASGAVVALDADDAVVTNADEAPAAPEFTDSNATHIDSVATVERVGPAAALVTENLPTARALPVGAIYEQAARLAYQKYPNAYLIDLYAEDDGRLFAILSSEGKLYRCEVTAAGDTVSLSEWQSVAVAFEPTGGEAAEGEAEAGTRSRTTIIRQTDGHVRWFSQSCSAVLNRVGEIDSTALFDSFVAAFPDNPRPIRQFYHAGEAFRTGECDFVARDGFVLITSGTFDDTDLARAEISAREREPEYWGESIGYDATQAPELVDAGDGVRLPLYRAGILREISTLPEHHAAALFTRTNQEVQRMALNAAAFQELARLFGGEEQARAWLAANPDATNRAIVEAGLVARAQPVAAEAVATQLTAEAVAAAVPEGTTETAIARENESAAADETETETETEGAADDDLEIDDETVAAIAQAVLESDTFANLSSRIMALESGGEERSRDGSARNQRYENAVAQLDERLQALEADEETKRGNWQADLPRVRTVRVSHRPRLANAPADGEAEMSLPAVAESTLEAIP